MIYVRGQPEDFDHWGQLGNRGWTWDDVLPFFRKAENWEGKEDAVHGKGGPLFTSHGRDKPLLCRAAVEAGRQLGLEYREDVNDLPSGAGDGIGWVQQTRGGAPARQHRTQLSAAGAEAAEPPGRHRCAGASGAVRRHARGGCRVFAQRRHGACRCRGRGDPGRRCDRLAAYPAAFRRRRPRASRAAPASRCITNCAASGAICRTTIWRASPVRCRGRRV